MNGEPQLKACLPRQAGHLLPSWPKDNLSSLPLFFSSGDTLVVCKYSLLTSLKPLIFLGT